MCRQRPTFQKSHDSRHSMGPAYWRISWDGGWLDSLYGWDWLGSFGQTFNTKISKTFVTCQLQCFMSSEFRGPILLHPVLSVNATCNIYLPMFFFYKYVEVFEHPLNAAQRPTSTCWLEDRLRPETFKGFLDKLKAPKRKLSTWRFDFPYYSKSRCFR